ncbi:MAG TPA: alpha-amylase family glycosyl hydrolase, partial [Spirochaetota bacterium]|nr:alpha-amylase family glycosyl hydrolase [Spirochaetota bacterium]
MNTEQTHGDGGDVILQAFHWNLVKTQGTGTVDGRDESWYAILKTSIERIAASGCTVLYLPPPWRDDSAWESNGRHGGGEGYYWHDFSLDSRYGTKAELVALVDAAHRNGLKVIVDIVLNHRDGGRMEADIWPWPGPCWRNGGADSGGAFMDGRFDLALNEPMVQERIRRALEELSVDCGVDGWRW